MGQDGKDGKKHKKKKGSSQGPEEFVVEAILDKKLEDGKTVYLVKWKDWPDSSNTWEPKANLKGCPDLMSQFEKDYQTRDKGNGHAEEEEEDLSDYELTDKTKEAKDNSIEVDVLEECPKSREPIELLGCVPIKGIMTYLVKWKPRSRGEEPEMNLVKSDSFKEKFPEAVISFYEKHIVWATDERLKDEMARDAILQLDRSNAANPDESVYPRTPQLKLLKTNNSLDVSDTSDTDTDSNPEMEVEAEEQEAS